MILKIHQKMNYLSNIPRDVLYRVLSRLNLLDLNIFKEAKLIPIEEFDSQKLWSVYFNENQVPSITKKESYWISEYKIAENTMKYVKDLMRDLINYPPPRTIYEYLNLGLISKTIRLRTFLIIENYLKDKSIIGIIETFGAHLLLGKNNSLCLKLHPVVYGSSEIIVTENSKDIENLLFLILYHGNNIADEDIKLINC